MRPVSANDSPFEVTKIRRDQRKKIAGIVQNYSKIPNNAISLIKEYCKPIEQVLAVRFDSDEDPTCIRVITRDTTYEYKLVLDEIIEPPTLY